MKKLFEDYSEVKLGDETKPFIVDDEHHPNLAIIAKAFGESNNVSLPGPGGYPHKFTTLDKNKEITPKIKKKNLYLTGGAVRDHLLNKTPRDYDLVTDATPDEIRLILKNAGFIETKNKPGYEHLPETGTKRKVFYINDLDKNGKEHGFIVKVNNEEFELNIFHNSHKGKSKTLNKVEFSNLEEDAAKRDLTVNSLYVPLNFGTNSKLIDPHGGFHHLKQNQLRFIGNHRERLTEEPLQLLRYIRFLAKSNGEIPTEYKRAIADFKELPGVSKELIRKEFLKGLENNDIDPKKYFRLYKDAGLLNTIFPGLTFRSDFPEKKDKRLMLAWILKDNDPEKVEQVLTQGEWTKTEISDIIHLIKLATWGSKHGSEDLFRGFYDIKKDFHEKTHLVPSLIRQWAEMNKLDKKMVDHYLKHELDTKAYVKDGFGNRVINPDLKSIYSGNNPMGSEFNDAIKEIETNKFRNKFNA